jgi:hypothetical protein
MEIQKEMIVANTIRILPIYCHTLGLVVFLKPMILHGSELKISTFRKWVPIGQLIHSYMIPCENPKIAEYDMIVFFHKSQSQSQRSIEIGEHSNDIILWVYLEKDISYRPLLEKIPNIQWEWFKLMYHRYKYSYETRVQK